MGVLVVGVLALSTAARADDKNEAREHYLKGSKAFDVGFYDEAVTEYIAAYRLRDDPALLYNIAQAHRLAGHPAEAIRFYRTYLSRSAKAANRAEVESKIVELQRLVEQQSKTQRMPPDKPMTPDGTTPPTKPEPVLSPAQDQHAEPQPQPSASEPTPASAASRVEADTHPGRTKKVAGLAVAGVGVAALVTGIALSAVAKGLEGDVVSQYNPQKVSDGNTFGTVGPILLGVGGAALVAGVVVAVLGVKESRNAHRPDVAVLPVLAPGAVAAVLRLGF